MIENNSTQTAVWLTPTAALRRFCLPETPPVVGKSETDPFFGFQIGSYAFLISVDTYCEVIEHLPVNPLPNVDLWFSGLLNLRGALVPVIDLHALFSQATTDNKRQLLVIDRAEKAMAIWIDGLPQIHNLASQPLKQLPPLPPLLECCVISGHLHHNQIWLNVQFDTLFKTLGDSYAT